MSVQLYFHCLVATLTLIMVDLQRAAKPPQTAQAHCIEGLLYWQLEQWPQAMTCYKSAIAEFRAAHDLAGLGQTCCHLGSMMLQRHRYGAAQRWAEIAVYCLANAEGSTTVYGQTHYAAALHLLGQIHVYQGHYALAVQHIEQVLAIRHELRDEVGEALALVDLGRAYQAQDQYWYALACYEGALDIGQSLEAVFEGAWFEARVRRLMAKLCRTCGRWDLAIKHHLEALALGRANRHYPTG